MVVAMVFITVTLISRSTVTPEESDAASIKKGRKLTVSSLSTSSKSSSTRRYTYLPMEVKGNLNSYPGGVNSNGYVAGSVVTPYVFSATVIWSPKGEYTDLPGLPRGSYNVSGINNSNTIIATDNRSYINKISAIKYSVSGGMVDLKALPGSKVPKPIMKPRINTFQNSMFSESPNAYSEISRPLYVNNDGDVVGISNNKAVLWINEKKDPVDLSSNIRIKEPNVVSTASYISDRKDGRVTILVDSYVDTGILMETAAKMYYIDYSIKDQKIISTTVQDKVDVNKLLWVEPKRILTNGSIAANYVPVNEKGAFRWDGYIFSSAKFEENIRLKDIVSKAGISSSTYWIVDINDTTIIGYYGLDDNWGNIKYFIVNYKTNTVDFIGDLASSGSIVGFDPNENKTIQPLFINSNGDIVVEIDDYSTSPTVRFPAKLILISE